jgi:hypothetical protein
MRSLESLPLPSGGGCVECRVVVLRANILSAADIAALELVRLLFTKRAG